MGIIRQDFFNRSAVVVAKELLGKNLCRRVGKAQVRKFKITETEAYEGFKDKASHASKGKTGRNAPMFGPPGTIYAYFTYGMHWMLNIVCGPRNHPAAVLIRGITSPNFQKINLSGPGRLTKYLGVDKKLNGQPLGRRVGLWVEDSKLKIENCKIENLPRVGVGYAGPVWANKKWRFVLTSSPNKNG